MFLFLGKHCGECKIDSTVKLDNRCIKHSVGVMSYRFPRIFSLFIGSGFAASVSSLSCNAKFKLWKYTYGYDKHSPTWKNFGKNSCHCIIQTLDHQLSILAHRFVIHAYCNPIENEVIAKRNANILDKSKIEIFKLVNKAKGMVQRNENPNKVEMIYLQALHMAIAINEHTTVTFIQDLLANFYLQTSNLDKAQEMFRVVLHNLISKGFSENDPAVLEITLKLASVFAQMNKHNLALSGYEWTCKICKSNLEEMDNSNKEVADSTEEKYKNQLALYGMALDSYGRYLLSIGNKEKALENTLQALDISTKLFGENDIRTLVLYNDVASIKCELNLLEDALEYVMKAVNSSKENIEAITIEDKAIFLCNLANIFFKQGHVDKAEDTFKQALIEVSKANDDDLKSRIGYIISSTLNKTKPQTKMEKSE